MQLNKEAEMERGGQSLNEGHETEPFGNQLILQRESVSVDADGNKFPVGVRQREVEMGICAFKSAK